MQKLQELKSHLKSGRLYKRAELEKWSKSVDRHLSQLLSMEILSKVGPGLYYAPKKNAFGIEPPNEEKLVQKYLDNSKFLITSFNIYNKLELGTTQLYNHKVVYNHLKSGDVKLGNKVFTFRKKSSFPTKQTAEFAVVDLVNNLDQLAEDQPKVLENVQKKVKELDPKAFSIAVEKYGTKKTRQLLATA